ncbi:MAG TPA: hypothetical protein PLY31_05840 [Tenuifilaceae bacterium]|jgi:hypothetical protein|nr:hypothetical protein [Candidatus Paceibacterota bacterium]HPW26633.1 hypothetical protein [Tenuifilaceae bacterium]
MGKVSDSFKRQIGRDAGKVVSNIIFGDKHSTPYRRVESKKQKAELEDKKMKIIQEKAENDDLYALDRAVNSSVDQIVAIQMPDNERAIVNLLNSLETLLESNSWEPEKDKEKKKAKIRNKYPDAVLNKFEQVLRELKFINANSERISFYQNRIDTFKKIQKKAKKAEVRQNIIIVTVILFIFLILIIASAA